MNQITNALIFGFLIKIAVTTEDNLIKCVNSIVSDYADLKLKMSVRYSVPNASFVTKFLKRTKIPVVINSAESQKIGLDLRTPSDFVLIVSGGVNITDVVKTTLWSTHTNFIVIGKRKSLGKIFKNFWDFKIVNVYGLIPRKGEVLIYSFLPYQGANCTIEEILIDKWINKNLVKKKWVNDKARIRDLNKCLVNVTIVDVKPNVIYEDKCGCNEAIKIDGIEGKIMTEISKKMNFTGVYSKSQDGVGWGWINPEPAGVAGEVYTGRSEFGFGLLGPTSERYENLDVTIPYDHMECLTYCVPKGAGAKQPKWINIIIAEFSPFTWFLIILTMFLAIIILRRLQQQKITEALLVSYVLSSCFEVPVRIPTGFRFRLIFALWIWFCFILTVAYKSSMGSNLTVPTPDPDINTFRELLNSKLELTGYANMLRTMQYQGNDGPIKEMADRFKVTNFDIESAVHKIVTERNIAHVRHVTTFLYYSLINENAKGKVHLLKECVYIYYPIFVMRKKSPLTNKVNDIISRLFQSGLIKEWKSKYIYDVKSESKKFVKLSMHHTFGAFFMVYVGWATSFLGFIAELVYYYLYEKRKVRARKLN